MSRIVDILEQLKRMNREVTTAEVADALYMDRSTASRYLNQLVRQGRASKTTGKPVKYKVVTSVFNQESGTVLNSGQESHQLEDVLKPEPDTMVDTGSFGFDSVGESLQPIIEQALAAFLYPSKSLPILLTGETGTGKTFLAEALSELAQQQYASKADVPFIVFNCADYAQNAELLVGQIFGIKEGAFTGATDDQTGLVEQADGGILFLDEIHQLPASGQEMLFYLMDKGVYRRLGEATQTRHANVTLIGATTEDPTKALLSTLMRRFSIKLNLPPLRERTKTERELLIKHFLNEEAKKMNTDLAITEEARQALLTYSCPGNIGQLKSDIQIACAQAYLRYLNNHGDQVRIQLSDFSTEVTAAFAPEKIVDNGNHQTENNIDEKSLPNIYEQMANHTDEKQLQRIIKKYIQHLAHNNQQSTSTKQGWQHLIDEDLFNALVKSQDKLSDKLSIKLDLNQLYVLGLHLQNFKKHQKSTDESLPIIIHPNVAYRQDAQQLAHYLYEEIGLALPKEEIELIPHFLSADHHTSMPTEQTVAVVLVTHGETTASSMATVTNKLLGNDVIEAINMPLHVPATDIYEQVKQKIKGMLHIKGALLLVDIGSLITMGDAIQHELQVPIKTLSSVNLPMVLEAGRKSLLPDLTLEDIYDATFKAMTFFIDKDSGHKTVEKKRMIVTVCFTGEGAAQLLESWINEQLSRLDQDVLIRTVRIDPTTTDTSMLNDLRNYYDIIAIIGTVPVSIDGVPYIPAWELLQQDGLLRMTKLLEVTRKTPAVYPETQDVSIDEIHPLVEKGLSEIVTYINPKKMTAILNRHLPQLRDFYAWETDRELGMWMHIGSLVDRMISAKINNQQEKLCASIPFDSKVIITEKEKNIWNPLFIEFKKVYQLEFSHSIKRELVKLSR